MKHMNQDKWMGRKALIRYYQDLLDCNIIQIGGAGHQRLKQLITKEKEWQNVRRYSPVN